MSNTKLLNNLETITTTLDQALSRYDNLVMYGEDIGFEGGVFRATKGLQAKHGENRIFDAPIAEATLIGSAIGMAINGLKVVVEYQFEGFSYPGLQQIMCHLSRFRNRSRGRFTCPVTIITPMGGGIKALEHHSEAIEAMLASLPGLKVIIPSTPYDFKGLLAAAIDSEDPVWLAEPTKIYRAFRQEVPEDWYTIEIGKGIIVKEGNDATLVTYGSQVVDSQKAVAAYEDEHPGQSIEIIDLRTIKPWDYELVAISVKKTGRLMVVHEACKSFSVSSEVIAKINETCFEYMKAPALRVTGYDIVIPYEKGEKYHMITPDRVKEGIIKLLAYEF